MTLRAVMMTVVLFILVIFLLVILSNVTVLMTNESVGPPRHGIVPHPPIPPVSHPCRGDEDDDHHSDHHGDRDDCRQHYDRDDCHDQNLRGDQT